MKWDTILKQVRKGEYPKIFVVDKINPECLFAGFVASAYQDDAKRVDLFPYLMLNVWHSRLSPDSGLIGTFDEGSPRAYNTLILEPPSNPELVNVTTSFEAHKRQAIGYAFDICEGKLESLSKYLQMAKNLRQASPQEVAQELRLRRAG